MGAGVAVVVLGVERPVAPPADTPLEPTVTSQGPGPGFGEVVPGFPDGLVAVARREGRGQELVVWPVGGEQMRMPFPVGSPTPPVGVRFDVSGGRVATLVPEPVDGARLLYAGVPESAAVVAVDVTGYAWHDSEPSRLAYTTFDAGETLLRVAGGNQTRGELIVRAVGIDGGVVAYGSWGFALHDDGDIVLLTAAGEIKTVTTGRVLSSHGSGWLLVENQGLWMLSAGGGLSRVELVMEVDERPLAAALSPDGERIAVLAAGRLLVANRQGEPEVDPYHLQPRLPAQLRWSSDGRFVLTPGFRGLEVIDTATGLGRTVLENEILTGVGVLPLDPRS